MFGRWKASAVASLLLISWAGTAPAQNVARRCGEGCPPCEAARTTSLPNNPALFTPAQIVARRTEGAQLRQAVELERNRTSALLVDARRTRDLPRYQCLFDRLTQLDWLVTASGEGHVALNDAIAVGDHARREHSFRLLQIYRQRAGVLATESARCGVVARAPVVNETVVSVRVPVAVADADE